MARRTDPGNPLILPGVLFTMPVGFAIVPGGSSGKRE
jgi:hypothetical protein